MGVEELRNEVRRLRTQLNEIESETGITRRKMLTSAATVASLGALGIYGSDVVSAQSSPTGTFPVATDPALLRLRADRVRLVPRTSDPSSPDGGTMWVVE